MPLQTKIKIKESQLQVFAYALLLPAFFLVSSLVYNPFDIQGFYSLGERSSGFHLLMLSCIILVTLLLTRNIFVHIQKKFSITWQQYVMWCVFELALIIAFIALYTILLWWTDSDFFAIFGICSKFVALQLCYPYGFLICMQVIRVKDEQIAMMESPADSTLIKFYDEHKRLRLSIAPTSILFISSEFNYVKIHYLDAGKMKTFLLRASMKSLESIANPHCLVRCQRSYYVNPEHIVVLRKNTDGLIFAELNVADAPPVPVSKQYYESLSALL